MKNMLQNELSYFPYNIGNMRVTQQQNLPVKRKMLKSREGFSLIEQKTLRQAKPLNTNSTKELPLILREKPIVDLDRLNRQQFYENLKDRLNFFQELKSLKQIYKFCDMNPVRGFLRKNRFLIPLLREIPKKIYDYFGKDQKLSLKVSFESDSPQLAELWVSVLTELSANEALLLLDRFDEEWWLENIDRADCKLNISLEYI